MNNYLYEIRVHEQQQANQRRYLITFHGEQQLLGKMIELAEKDTAFLVLKETTKWHRFLFKRNYMFSIQDIPAADSPLPSWNLASILKGNEVVALPPPLSTEFTAKALQEELMGYAAKVASRQGKLFRG